jgi:hypothetical protein
MQLTAPGTRIRLAGAPRAARSRPQPMRVPGVAPRGARGRAFTPRGKRQAVCSLVRTSGFMVPPLPPGPPRVRHNSPQRREHRRSDGGPEAGTAPGARIDRGGDLVSGPRAQRGVRERGAPAGRVRARGSMSSCAHHAYATTPPNAANTGGAMVGRKPAPPTHAHRPRRRPRERTPSAARGPGTGSPRRASVRAGEHVYPGPPSLRCLFAPSLTGQGLPSTIQVRNPTQTQESST